MGYPHDCLVPAAILLDNPGMTRDEFVSLLDGTHSSSLSEFDYGVPWDSHYAKELTYHGGLEELAGILGLGFTKKGGEFKREGVDENGLCIRAPYVLPAREEDPHKFEVIVHEGNVVKEPIRHRTLSWGTLEIGDVWQEVQMGLEKAIVVEIYCEKDLHEEREEEEWESSGPDYEYDFLIKPIEERGRLEKFDSEPELFER